MEEAGEVVRGITGCDVDDGSKKAPSGTAISWVIVVNTRIEAVKSIPSWLLQTTRELSRYSFTRDGTSNIERDQKEVMLSPTMSTGKRGGMGKRLVLACIW